eukprot:jgi/Botrbrau1/19535/Bobra.0035s0029.1
MVGMDMNTLPSGPFPHPKHGGWLGHMLPGWFFMGWSSWWLYSIFRLYLGETTKQQYTSRSWFEFPYLQSLPVEPLCKVLFTFLGINGELWFGHESFRHLIGSNGFFIVDNLNEWQHSVMYLAFFLSGAVDLIGFYTPPGTLPRGTEQAMLGVAFTVEGLLFAFHLEGEPLNYNMHFLLVVLVFAAAICIFAEIKFNNSILISTLKAQLVLLQGIWFCMIAKLLFEEHVLWDPRYHGSVMMMPVTFCVWVLIITFTTIVVYVMLRTCTCSRSSSYVLAKMEEGSSIEAVPLKNDHSA